MSRLAAVVGLVIGAWACGGHGDGERSEATAEDPSAEPPPGVGSLFLVEHFTVAVNASLLDRIETDPPGGIVFWNSNQAGATELREVIRAYSAAARDAGHPPILFSTDYEGGATSLAPSGHSIPGVQRFRRGLTWLLHPRWLGVAFRQDSAAGLELAELHGEIMARELRSVGIVYPLSVVGDLASGLFTVRGLDPDEQIAAELLSSVLLGFGSVPDVVFVTKHFPGLGQTRGDTHDETVVSPLVDRAEAERHLVPFRAALDQSRALGQPARLSLMCSHGVFPAFDPDLPTTVSPAILRDLLRTELQAEGLAVSDAMWMGEYGHLSGRALQRVYAQSFLAGMDLLMIPGAAYAGALSYFRRIDLGTIEPQERQALEALTGQPWADIATAWRARRVESAARLEATLQGVSHAADIMDAPGTVPTVATEPLRARYRELALQAGATLGGE